MSAAQRIEKVLQAKVLIPELCLIPSRGATEEELNEEQRRMGRIFRPDHASLLQRWNGIGLEVIRMFGCGNNANELGQISQFQEAASIAGENGIVIGSDAPGFIYIQRNNGTVVSFDTDGGKLREIAQDLNDLFERLIFGPDAAQFLGAEWLNELRTAGIV